MKFNQPDFIALDHSGYSVYGNVLSPNKVVVKRESFPEGEVPPHLTGYIGQTAKVAKACKGKREYAYTICLREKAKEHGVTKKGAAPTRRRRRKK